jgi:hypothetical protein
VHQFATARRDSEAAGEEAVLEVGYAMERVKNAVLVFCLFVALLVIFSSCFRATELGTFFGALAATPVLVHAFNRVAPSKQNAGMDRAVTAELVARAEPVPRPTEQVFVLRMEGPNGRT